MATRPSRARDVARVLFLDGRASNARIAATLGISRHTVAQWARTDGWQRGSAPADDSLVSDALRTTGTDTIRPPAQPVPPSDRNQLVNRLYRIIDHTIRLLETRMSNDPAAPDAMTERDMRALGNIVRSIDKLKDLEPGHGKPDPDKPKAGRAPATPDEEDRLRKRIVERILKLRERRGAASGGR